MIFVHEFGHFIVARLNKIDVSVFSIGVGPRRLSFKDKKSLKDNILGPNPILKTETSILLRRATMKCPNSCTKITIPNANTIDKN